jgi:YesN/AraC family two-component response regulator
MRPDEHEVRSGGELMNKVLVIDDEKPTLVMFRLTLSAYGYMVFTAENGIEGLEVFERERPPLVLTDIKMPGMDGIEVLKRIKEVDPRAEVIVITGHGDMDLAIKALNLDAADFINKPIDRQVLEQALKRANERRKIADSTAQDISLQSRANAAVINIQGSLTSQSEASLQDAYNEAGSMEKELIVFHFHHSTTVNGAGIAILTQLLLDSRKRQQNVAIAGLSENFRKVFEIVGIAKLVRMYDSLEQACSEQESS